MNEKRIPHPMGIGPIGHPRTVILQKFRWTLAGTHLSENSPQRVSFDFIKRIIKFDCVLAVFPGQADCEVLQWLDRDLFKEELVFSTFDGCGNYIYESRFSGLTLLENTSVFDYSISEVAIQQITLSYNNSYRKSLLSKDSTVELRKSLAGSSHQLEEVELNFLNSKLKLNSGRKRKEKNEQSRKSNN